MGARQIAAVGIALVVLGWLATRSVGQKPAAWPTERAGAISNETATPPLARDVATAPLVEAWFLELENASELSVEQIDTLADRFRELARSHPEALARATARRLDEAHEGPLAPAFLLAALVVDWGEPARPLLARLLAREEKASQSAHLPGPGVRLDRVKAYALRKLAARGLSEREAGLIRMLERIASEEDDLDVAREAAMALASTGKSGRNRALRAWRSRPASQRFTFDTSPS